MRMPIFNSCATFNWYLPKKIIRFKILVFNKTIEWTQTYSRYFILFKSIILIANIFNLFKKYIWIKTYGIFYIYRIRMMYRTK